jgi:hypothetical protein
MRTIDQLNAIINVRAEFIKASVDSNTQRGRKVTDTMRQHFGIRFNQLISGK